MRKSVKRFLSTILALTMLCSCMVIANVGTVFADESTTSYTYSVDSNYTEADSTETDRELTNTSTTNVVTIKNAAITTNQCASGYINSAQLGKFNSDNTPKYIQIPVTGACTVTIVASTNSTSSSGTAGFYVSSTAAPTKSTDYASSVDLAKADKTAENTITYSYTGEGATNVYFYSTGSIMRFAAVTVTYGETSGDSGETGGETGGEDEPSTSVTFASIFNASDCGYASGDEVEVTSLTSDKLFKLITAPSDKTTYSSFTSSSVKITLATGDSITSSLCYSTGGGGDATKRSISFKTGSTAGDVYYYAASNSSTEKTITVVDSNGSSEGITLSAEKVGSKGSYAEVKISGLAANTEYNIAADGTVYVYYVGSTEELAEFDALPTVDTTNCVVTGTDNTVYYIAGLDSSVDVDSVETCQLVSSGTALTNETTDSATIGTVYEGVSVDGLTIPANRFGYAYVYGFKVESDSEINNATLKSTYSLSTTSTSESE